MKYIKDIVLTKDQVERYTKELASDTWKKYYKDRNYGWFGSSKKANW